MRWPIAHEVGEGTWFTIRMTDFGISMHLWHGKQRQNIIYRHLGILSLAKSLYRSPKWSNTRKSSFALARAHERSLACSRIISCTWKMLRSILDFYFFVSFIFCVFVVSVSLSRFLILILMIIVLFYGPIKIQSAIQSQFVPASS